MEAQQSEMFDGFPVIQSKTKAKSWIRQYLEASAEHGTLCTSAMAARALGLHRSRIGQLLDAGKLASVNVGSTRYIPAAALELFMTEERLTGRPRLSAVRQAVEKTFRK